jgi:alanyl-tRNA synthetase
MLGQRRPFFHMLVPALDAVMGEAYPELRAQVAHVARVLRQEEERFAETLAQGMALLDGALARLSGSTIPGETVFKLYDTYGFPVDLTADIARERGLAIDEAGFETAMEEQRRRARAASRFGVDMRGDAQVEGRTEFTGYEHDRSEANVVALLKGNEPVSELAAGEEGQVVLDATPFYAESGGQVGDTGLLQGANARFRVADTRKLGRAYSHLGRVEQGSLKVGDRVEAIVDAERRNATRLNHTATHLLHAALRKVLGTHVTQKGSLVAPDRLRFDFSHYAALTPEELREIERQVNAEIRANAPAETRVMKFDDAVASGAMALFGEKYDEDVRVLRLGDYSTELCGGTHVARAGDIGLFPDPERGRHSLRRAPDRSRHRPGGTRSRRRHRPAPARRRRPGARIARRPSGESTSARRSRPPAGKGNFAAQVEARERPGTRSRRGCEDDRRHQCDCDLGRWRGCGRTAHRGRSVEEPSQVGGDRARIGRRRRQGHTHCRRDAGCDRACEGGELVNYVAQQVGGKGGGRPDLAQAGGSQPQNLASALESVAAWIAGKLS